MTGLFTTDLELFARGPAFFTSAPPIEDAGPVLPDLPFASQLWGFFDAREEADSRFTTVYGNTPATNGQEVQQLRGIGADADGAARVVFMRRIYGGTVQPAAAPGGLTFGGDGEITVLDWLPDEGDDQLLPLPISVFVVCSRSLSADAFIVCDARESLEQRFYLQGYFTELYAGNISTAAQVTDILAGMAVRGGVASNVADEASVSVDQSQGVGLVNFADGDTWIPRLGGGGAVPNQLQIARPLDGTVAGFALVRGALSPADALTVAAALSAHFGL